MRDNNIKRFCELVFKIKTLNDELDKNREEFYDGGHPFEEVYEQDLKELPRLENQLRVLLREIPKFGPYL